MKYVIKKLEQGFPFYIKAVDAKQRALSIEVDPAEAKQFDTEDEAKAYMDDNGLSVGFSIENYEPQVSDAKIITYEMDGGDGCMDLICQDKDNLIEALKTEIENAIIDMPEGDEHAFVVTIRVQRKRTLEEGIALPDWDGF